jgi:hypothetical protein
MRFLPQTTVKRYLALLEAAFLVLTVPAWFRNVGKRLIKSPKLILSDAGLLAHLLGEGAAVERSFGAVLENFEPCLDAGRRIRRRGHPARRHRGGAPRPEDLGDAPVGPLG